MLFLNSLGFFENRKFERFLTVLLQSSHKNVISNVVPKNHYKTDKNCPIKISS